MTPIAAMILEMLARGVDAEVIALAVSTAEQAIYTATIPRNSTEIRIEKRKEKDRLRKQAAKGIPRNSTENAGIPWNDENTPISTSKNSKESKRQNRGTRIPPDWTLSDAERAFAKQEGFSDWEIQRETQKFRDYWTACAGSKGVKLDWPATWRQWIRSGAERAGKRPAPSANAVAEASSGYYAASDSEQLTAWDEYTKRTTGKLLPRDRNFGWRVPSEWPPDYISTAAAPLLRAMQ